MFGALAGAARYFSPGKPEVVVDSPTPGAKGQSKSDLNTAQDKDDYLSARAAGSSLSPSQIRDDSTYGDMYKWESDPAVRAQLEAAANSKHKLKTIMKTKLENQVLLGVPSTKIGKQKADAKPQQEVGVNVDPGLMPILAQERRTLGSAKGALTRMLNELEKRKNDGKYLDAIFEKLDIGMSRLQEANEAFLAVPGLTEAEVLLLTEQFSNIDDQVTHAKNFATTQLSMLERRTPDKGGKKHGISRETPTQEFRTGTGSSKKGSRGSKGSRDGVPPARALPFGNTADDAGERETQFRNTTVAPPHGIQDVRVTGPAPTAVRSQTHTGPTTSRPPPVFERRPDIPQPQRDLPPERDPPHTLYEEEEEYEEEYVPERDPDSGYDRPHDYYRQTAINNMAGGSRGGHGSFGNSRSGTGPPQRGGG